MKIRKSRVKLSEEDRNALESLNLGAYHSASKDKPQPGEQSGENIPTKQNFGDTSIKHSDISPDRRKIEELVDTAFQESCSAVKTVISQHEGAPNRADAYYDIDLSGDWKRRRMDATIKYSPKIREMFGDLYPENNLEENMACLNSAPVSTYDYLDCQYHIVLGAAIFILDELKKNGRIYKAFSYFPDSPFQIDEADMPNLYDPCNSDEVLRSVVYILQGRNREKYEWPPEKRPRYLADGWAASGEGSAEEMEEALPARKRYHGIMNLLDQSVKDRAARYFEEKLWEWLGLFFKCENRCCKKLKRVSEQLEQIVRQRDIIIRKQEASLNRKKTVNTSGAQSAAFRWNGPFADGRLAMENELQELLEVEERLEKIRANFEKYSEKHSNLKAVAYCSSSMTLEKLEQYMDKESARLLYGFTVEKPYELCFGLLYLLDSGSDLPWLYYPGLAVTAAAGAKLPWGCVEYDEEQDEAWPMFGDKNGSIADTEENITGYPDWDALDETSEAVGVGHKDSVRMNLSQIVYALTGAIMPRDQRRYDNAREKLLAYGMGEEKTNHLIDCIRILGESQRMSRNWDLDMHTDDWSREDTEEPDHSSENLEEKNAALQEANTALKKEIERLKSALYETHREAKEGHKRYDMLLQETQNEHKELIDLRELVFNNSRDREEQVKIEQLQQDIVYPYKVKKKIVVFGGHDAWLKVIRSMLEGVRFIDADMLPNTGIIKNADTVWLQTNYMSHSGFYKIINTVRTYNVPIRYFRYNSAEKCAEQIVMDDRE